MLNKSHQGIRVVAVALVIAAAVGSGTVAAATCPTKDTRLITKAMYQRLATYGYSRIHGRCERDGEPFVTLWPIDCWFLVLWRHDKPEPALRPALFRAYGGPLIRSGYFGHRVFADGQVSVNFAAIDPKCPPVGVALTEKQAIANIIFQLRP